MKASEIVEKSLSDIFSNADLNRNFYAPPWLCTKTINMLFAPAGAGKSHWAFNLALAISKGDSWLGEQCTQGKVLYIDGEMGGDSWIRRLSGDCIMGDFEDSFKMICPEDFKGGSILPLSDKANHAFWLEKCSQYDVIFIDNYITCCLPTTGQDSDIGLFLVLKDLLVKLKNKGKAIVLIHHTNKGGSDQHGTVYKDVIMDTIFRLKQWPQQYLLNGLTWEVKIFKDRNNFFGKKTEMAIEIEFNDSGIFTEERDIDELRQVLVKNLLDRGIKPSGIADELGLHPNRVLELISKVKQKEIPNNDFYEPSSDEEDDNI